jgi:DNA-binding MarR family transcriptional regulator
MEKTNNIIVQKLRTQLTDSYSVAEKYYSLLSAVNNLGLTPREIQLIAFTAIKGNISYANIRSEFCEKYKSSPPTINNMISKLKKIGVFVKDGTKVKVNPVIVLNFDKDITLQINVVHG